MSGDKALIDFVLNNEQDIRKWLKSRPTAEGTYEDLLRDAKSGAVSVNRYDPSEWNSVVSKAYKGKAHGSDVAAFYSPGTKTINLQTDKLGSLPHEAMHYFASHRPSERGVPEKINPYIKADMKLKGWLPSLHPGGRRPTMPGKFGPGKWWNEKMATKSAAYSDKEGYHAWFDEHAFDLAKKFGSKSSPSTNIKTKKFDIKNKIKKLFTREEEAPSFGSTFRDARKEGLDEFEWQGKKYHTKYKEEMKPKPKEKNFLDNWKKSWAFRGSNY